MKSLRAPNNVKKTAQTETTPEEEPTEETSDKAEVEKPDIPTKKEEVPEPEEKKTPEPASAESSVEAKEEVSQPEKTKEPEEVKEEVSESTKEEPASAKGSSEAKEEPTPEKKSFFYSDVPNVDKNAPLKIDEESDEDLDLPQIEKSNKKLFLLGIVVFIITIVITIGVGFFILNNISTGKKAVTSEESEKTVRETPTPVVTIDKKEWTFEVLNGSGEAGKAKKTADAIKAIGYVVDSTGNAGKSDYTGVTVSFIKEIKNDVKDIILKDLKKEFITVKEDDAPTDKTESSILVIIGK